MDDIVFENIIDRKCDKCGKNFVPAPYHAYVDGRKAYCSWTCYNHRHDRPRGKICESNRPQQTLKFARQRLGRVNSRLKCKNASQSEI